MDLGASQMEHMVKEIKPASHLDADDSKDINILMMTSFQTKILVQERKISSRNIFNNGNSSQDIHYFRDLLQCILLRYFPVYSINVFQELQLESRERIYIKLGKNV